MSRERCSDAALCIPPVLRGFSPSASFPPLMSHKYNEHNSLKGAFPGEGVSSKAQVPVSFSLKEEERLMVLLSFPDTGRSGYPCVGSVSFC